uniref:Uncharacterized protein n=1 Tax=Thermogemmatispora argillosa TaxID=2045280 RepID=A0A455T488_9CHLR|nr:hypothetical protein KTA_14840 [Thermogemmatispora argillosa]
MPSLRQGQALPQPRPYVKDKGTERCEKDQRLSGQDRTCSGCHQAAGQRRAGPLRPGQTATLLRGTQAGKHTGKQESTEGSNTPGWRRPTGARPEAANYPSGQISLRRLPLTLLLDELRL